VADSARQRADTVTDINAITAPASADRTPARGEDHSLSKCRIDYLRGRLGARTLLDQNELAAIKIMSRLVE